MQSLSYAHRTPSIRMLRQCANSSFRCFFHLFLQFSYSFSVGSSRCFYTWSSQTYARLRSFCDIYFVVLRVLPLAPFGLVRGLLFRRCILFKILLRFVFVRSCRIRWHRVMCYCCKHHKSIRIHTIFMSKIFSLEMYVLCVHTRSTPLPVASACKTFFISCICTENI